MLKDIIEFYRVKNCIKIVGLAVIGVTINYTNLNTSALAILQSVFLLTFLFAYHDLNDYKVERKKYPIGKLVEKSQHKKVIILIILPLILSLVVLLINFSLRYMFFYIIFLILAIGYSAPKIRLGDVPFVDVATVVSIFLLIFIQSYFYVNIQPNEKFYFFVAWIILFYIPLEILHQLSHYKKELNSMVLFLKKKNSVKILRYPIILTVLVGIVIYLQSQTLQYYSLIMIMFAIIRFAMIRKVGKNVNFEKYRHGMGGLFEGLSYIVLNLIG